VDSRNWLSFTQIQRLSFGAISIDPDSLLSDFVLEAETSSGKTEAAFLPLLAHVSLAKIQRPNSFSVLYVSPLRALINDAKARLTDLARTVGLMSIAGTPTLAPTKPRPRRSSSGYF
jgi:ATP-dependent helicase Lhr and Lhr-like helicase